MKNVLKTIRIGGYIVLFFLVIQGQAQIKLVDYKVDVGEYPFAKNDAQNPCITSEEYALLDKEVSDNLKKLGLENTANRNTLTTSFIWPLKPKTGFSQCSYHFIGAYVDQNTATTAIQDYNCEANTYDGHTGTDIAVWPYSFYKMDNNQMEVIAAAAGTIIQRADGNFDRNCVGVGSGLIANSITIQHADGSYALYWHMKSGSVTSKIVGQTVVAGEYLGIVGSSGSSSGPHLHFEARIGSTSASYKDPFSGTCNTLNATSWWASQRPHTEPTIMKVSVNTTDITFANCPNSDILTESDTFLVPFQGPGLTAGYAKFYLFLRDIPVNGNLSMRILNPNGTIFNSNSWNFPMPTYYKTSYVGFSKVLPTIDGTYTFDATYNGVTCSKQFTIVHSLGISENSNSTNLKLYPNPTNNEFILSSDTIENGDYEFTLTNITGQIIKKGTTSIQNNKLAKNFSITEFENGIYFIIIKGEKTCMVKKIVKS